MNLKQIISAQERGVKVDTGWVINKWLDTSYGDQSPRQKLDIYVPETSDGPFPVIFAIHGGAFKYGDKADEQLLPMLAGLKLGYAVVSVNSSEFKGLNPRL